MIPKLPDIYNQVAEMIRYYRGVVEHGHCGFPSAKDARAIELMNLWLTAWLETQKEEALAIAMPEVLSPKELA